MPPKPRHPPSAANAGVNVIVEPNAPPAVRRAATELRAYLRQLYPTAAGKQIRLVTNLSTPESYEITATENEATIAGGGPARRGVWRVRVAGEARLRFLSFR